VTKDATRKDNLREGECIFVIFLKIKIENF
jgi:hypothetical protein